MNQPYRTHRRGGKPIEGAANMKEALAVKVHELTTTVFPSAVKLLPARSVCAEEEEEEEEESEQESEEEGEAAFDDGEALCCEENGGELPTHCDRCGQKMGQEYYDYFPFLLEEFKRENGCDPDDEEEEELQTRAQEEDCYQCWANCCGYRRLFPGQLCAGCH